MAIKGLDTGVGRFRLSHKESGTVSRRSSSATSFEMPIAQRMKSNASRPEANDRKRILLVDDHPLMREGIALWVARSPELEVCGLVGSAEEALGSVEKLRPALVVTDVSLNGRSGLELIKDLQTYDPGLPVLVVSMHDEKLYAERVIRAGARGYIMKEAGGEKLIEAIKTVLSGHVYVSPRMSAAIVENMTARKPRGSNAPLLQLSDREFEVFELIGEGLTTNDIARRLKLSPKTVDVHRRNIREKLQIADVTGLIRYAVRWAEARTSGKEAAPEPARSRKPAAAKQTQARKKK
jgi:DNA-binding NarL/FixJ family response regulator